MNSGFKTRFDGGQLTCKLYSEVISCILAMMMMVPISDSSKRKMAKHQEAKYLVQRDLAETPRFYHMMLAGVSASEIFGKTPLIFNFSISSLVSAWRQQPQNCLNVVLFLS